jgi:hypothetical protein
MDVRRRDISKLFSEIQKLKSEQLINLDNFINKENNCNDAMIFAVKNIFVNSKKNKY